MVLNGIGGKTIKEAKESLSYSEALLWQAYIKKHGTLHVGRRIENQTGLLGMISSGGHVPYSQLAPFDHANAMNDLENVVKQFGAVVVSNEEVKKLQAKSREKRNKGKGSKWPVEA